MYNYRFSKRAALCAILCVQLFALGLYFRTQTKPQMVTHPEKVLFLNRVNSTPNTKRTYHARGEKIELKQFGTQNNYVDFNTSVCFVNGTNVEAMKRFEQNWQCNCLEHWHGKDCSQPEVVWRAFLAYRRPVNIAGPRKYQRRLIYVFDFDSASEELTEIRINELKDVVDLYVILQKNPKGFPEKFKSFREQILLLTLDGETNVWGAIKNAITNLKSDDIVLKTEQSEIPNKYALLYFKFNDKWPEPLAFRLRWSVYGFFWLHPSKTILSGCATTVEFLEDILKGNLRLLNAEYFSKIGKTFTIGDLNHFGGWYCELCFDPSSIIESLYQRSSKRFIKWDESNKQSINVEYVEDLIENGIYLDGKTNLLRTHRNSETYYAPRYVEDNGWKYDYLLTNMYSKLDF